MTQATTPVEFVIGVDTHKHTHTGAVVNALGAELALTTCAATAVGYRDLFLFAQTHTSGARCWAIEGTGSYGRGLTRYLLQHGERVFEIDRPQRPARPNGAKTDALDATRAAREWLTRPHTTQPRRRGWREALRVLLRTRKSAVKSSSQAIGHLKALVVTAPIPLRQRLDALTTTALVTTCARLRGSQRQDVEHRVTVCALRSTARRIQALDREAKALKAELTMLIEAIVPELLAEPGIGPISAAEIVCAWSHHGRIRSEAAFAMLAGVAPIPASSGQTRRYRLNRGGDRQLNCALHTIARSRLMVHEETQRYAARRKAEGKSPREIRRCITRALARRLFRLLEALPMPT